MKQSPYIRLTTSTQSLQGSQASLFAARHSTIIQIYAHLLVSRLTLNPNKHFQNDTTWGLLRKGSALRRSSFSGRVGQRRLLQAMEVYRTVGFKHATVRSGVGLSRLMWYTVVRLIRQQRLSLTLKGAQRSDYDQNLAEYSHHLAIFKKRQGNLLRLNSRLTVTTRRMYLWLTHVYKYFEKHKQKISIASQHWTVRLERLFFTPYTIRLLGQIGYQTGLLNMAGRKVAVLQRALRGQRSAAAVRINLLQQGQRSALSMRRAVGLDGAEELVTLKYAYPRSPAELASGNFEQYNIFTRGLGSQCFSRPVGDCQEGVNKSTFLFSQQARWSGLQDSPPPPPRLRGGRLTLHRPSPIEHRRRRRRKVGGVFAPPRKRITDS